MFLFSKRLFPIQKISSFPCKIFIPGLREKNRRIRELETELMLAAKRVSLEFGSESSSQASSDY